MASSAPSPPPRARVTRMSGLVSTCSGARTPRVRVRIEVGIAPPPIRNMRVDLGRPEVRVPEHLLDAAQVRAPFEQVRGERVTEETRVDPFRVEARLRREPPDDQEGAGACERAALGVEEDLRAVAPVEVGAPAGEVAPQRLDRLVPERDDALLVALAEAAHGAVLEVDAAALEPDRLAHADATAVQELDERAVAQAPRRRAVGGVDQALDLAERERAGELLAPPRQVDVGGRVVAPLSERDEVAVEGARGGGAARDRAGRLPPRAQVGQP